METEGLDQLNKVLHKNNKHKCQTSGSSLSWTFLKNLNPLQILEHELWTHVLLLQPPMSTDLVELWTQMSKISKGNKAYLILHAVFRGEPTHKDAKVHYHRN